MAPFQAHTRAVVEGEPYSNITKLGSLPADCPISRVITMSEVITLPIIKSFQLISRILSSKEFPVIIRYVALMNIYYSITLATEFII